MECKKCGSPNVQKNGHDIRGSGIRQRFICRDCRHRWREPNKNPKEEYGTQTAKVLLLDIETASMQGRFWRLGKQVIGMEQITKDWFILGWSAKWLFDSEVFSDFVTPEESLNRDDKRIMQSLWKLIDDASILIGHNIKGFDAPKITTRFIFYKMDPPSPYQLLDTYLAIKPLGFSSNKLQYVCEYMELKEKLRTDYQLWIDCENGNAKRLLYMEKYCKRDCIALEEAFIELRPYIKTGINFALHNHSSVPCCSSCGSPDLTEKGYYYTSVSRFISFKCNNCGSYSRQRTNDVKIRDRKVLLSPVAR
jgi:transposase-like protein